jgi:sugar phosphate isomerase/epimerase
MNLYYKYFIRDKKSSDFLTNAKLNNDIDFFEIADYHQTKDKITENIKDIYTNNKIYHSQNKKFGFFYYFSNQNTDIYQKLETTWYNYWEEEFKYSDSINCKKIIIHFLQYSYSNDKNIRLEFIKENYKYLKFLFSLSEKYNVKIYFENSFEKNPEEFFDVIEYIDNNFNVDYGICFDIGHANVWGNYNASVIDWVNKIEISSKDIHYHLHTNSGMLDAHQSIVAMINNQNVTNIKDGLHALLKRKMIKNATLEVDYDNFLEDAAYLRNFKV